LAQHFSGAEDSHQAHGMALERLLIGNQGLPVAPGFVEHPGFIEQLRDRQLVAVDAAGLRNAESRPGRGGCWLWGSVNGGRCLRYWERCGTRALSGRCTAGRRLVPPKIFQETDAALTAV